MKRRPLSIICVRRSLALTILVVFSCLTALQTAGSPPTFQSGPDEVFLLELYTSEGCSSCPPADRWYSGLKDSDDLWDKIVPVAFHVDYWDYLGWKDPLSSKAHTQRQRAYATAWGSPTIYTPGFVCQGREKRWGSPVWRGTHRGKPGRLAATLDGNKVAVIFRPESREENWTAYAALLAFDFDSNVSRGENRGRRLSHDFSVLEIQKTPLSKEGNGGFVQFSQKALAQAGGVAVWVTGSESIYPVQAAGGYIR